jgi:hypothetical protein
MRAVAEKPYEPASELGPALNAWLARALAKRPEDRFQDAASMAQGLRGAG